MNSHITVCERSYSDQFKTGVLTMFLITDNVLFQAVIVLI